jgi:hypothetical protein
MHIRAHIHTYMHVSAHTCMYMHMRTYSTLIYMYTNIHACHISSGCQGSTKSDVKKCGNCTSWCCPGEVLEGTCDGSQYEDVVKCTTCTLGTYVPSRNATACVACAGGFYSDSGAASACSACEAGTYSEPGSTTCTSCSEWQCEQGDWRSVCTGSRSGTCEQLPTWTQLEVAGATLPQLSKHSMAALPNGMAYIFGGQTTAVGNSRTDVLYRVELGSTSVPIVTLMKPAAGTAAPPARDSHAMACIGYDVFVSGGLSGSSAAGTYMDDFWVLKQPGNWSRSALANLPMRMAGHKMTETPDGILWLFGGQGSSGQALGKLYYINPKNLERTWAEYTVATLPARANSTILAPQPRWDFGLVSQKYRIFVSCVP